MDNNVVLKTEKIGIDFGGLTAVNDLDITIHKNEIYGLIGPNGAGKTTVFNLLTKVYMPTRGNILLNGESLLKYTTPEVNKMGIARTFQNIRLFNQLSVIDNVLVGYDHQLEYGLFDALFQTPKYRKQEKEKKEKAIELLKVFNLEEFKDVKASSLPYGAQRRLEIVRALATNPKLLLLDEPAAGMNESETLDLMNTIRKVRDDYDISILLIEHDMKFVMGICDYITVLNFGQTLAEGKPDEIKNNQSVIEAYIGGE